MMIARAGGAAQVIVGGLIDWARGLIALLVGRLRLVPFPRASGWTRKPPS